MMWNLILLYSALAGSVLSESQSLQEIGWLPCELVEEYNQPDSSGNIETHYKRRNAVLQFSHPGDSAVNPDSITFFVMASKVNMRKYVQAGVEEVQCDIHRYNAGGIEARWPGPGAQEHDRWFTCTLRHSGGLFILTTFLRYTPTVAQADDPKWVIEDRDRLITTAAMLVMTRSPSVEVGLLREQSLHCQFAVDHKQPELVLEWRVQKRGERSKLFSYSSRSGQSEGAGVSLKDIAAGLGSLRLPATTLANEGTYICSVYVPPLYGSHDLALHIVESPQVTLNVATPLSLEVGQEQKVVCEAQGYYPLDVQMDWLREQRGRGQLPEVLKNVLFSSHRHHQDGTYSLSAFFLLRPTATDSGYTYTCRVSHRSLRTPVRKSFTLAVTEPVHWSSMLLGVLGVGFSVLMIVSLVLMLRYLHSARREANKRKPY